MATLAPEVDKLPLAVRKNIRDEWEAKVPEFEKQLSDLVGEKWTITANYKLIFPNVADESYASRLGAVITWYVKPLLSNIKKFVDKYGEDGKQELNSTVSKHEIQFGPQDTTKFSYGGLVVEDGVLRLVYDAPKSFASNVDDVSRGVAEALKAAAATSGGGNAYNIVAREGVKANYESKIGEVQKTISSLLGVSDIKLTPNFEANADGLSKAKGARDDWDRILGKSSLSYFEAVASQLKRAGFEKDDMLQEGFQEAVSKNEISLRVVDKLEKSGTYNEVVIKDGVLYVQTTADKWWSNVDETGSKILDLLGQYEKAQAKEGAEWQR